MVMAGWRFSSGASPTTCRDRPVTSSTSSCRVKPSCKSLNWTVPPISVRMAKVYGSHSAITWPSVTGAPSSTLAVHHHQIADLGAHGLESHEADRSVVLGVEPGLLADSRCRTADVEGTHGELRSGLADGLRRDHAGGFTQFDHAAGGEVASVTGDADTAL